MQLTPKNRHIQLEELNATAAAQKGFVLPDDYKPPAKEYECYRVVSQADDCTHDYESGSMVAVERHMVKSLDVNGTRYLLILENYVLASLHSA